MVLPIEDLDITLHPNLILVLVDTSSDPSERYQQSTTLERADAVLLVVTAEELLAEESDITGRYKTLLQRHCPRAPVCVAVNKIDTLAAEMADQVAVKLAELVTNERMIEQGITMSAFTGENVQNALFVTIRMGVLPATSLSAGKNLSGDAKRALTRIFTLADADGDGALDDPELQDWHRLVNGHTLDGAELKGLKAVIAEKCPEGIRTVDVGGHAVTSVTLDGFLEIHHQLVETNKADLVWRVLAVYGYDTTLALSREYAGEVDLALHARQLLGIPGDVDEVTSTIKAIGCDHKVSFELGQDLVDWLTTCHNRFATDIDGEGAILTYHALDADLLVNCLTDPFAAVHDEYRTIFPTGLNHRHWLELWRALALIDPVSAVLTLVALNFPSMPGVPNTTTKPATLVHMAHTALRPVPRHSGLTAARKARRSVERKIFRLIVVGHTRPEVPLIVRDDRTVYVTHCLTHAELASPACRTAGPNNAFNHDGIVIIVGSDEPEHLNELAGTLGAAMEGRLPVRVAQLDEALPIGERTTKVLEAYHLSTVLVGEGMHIVFRFMLEDRVVHIPSIADRKESLKLPEFLTPRSVATVGAIGAVGVAVAAMFAYRRRRGAIGF